MRIKAKANDCAAFDNDNKMYNWGQFAGFGVKKRGLNYQPVTQTLPKTRPKSIMRSHSLWLRPAPRSLACTANMRSWK